MVVFRRTPWMDAEPSTPDDTVFVKEFPKKGCVSGFDLKIQASNAAGAYGNPSGDILNCINKIEVVRNGDDRLFSMSGNELFQHLWVVNGKPPLSQFNRRNADDQFVRFPIRFGRFLGDPNFGLKLDNWDSVQLLVDYALTPITSDAGASVDGFTTATMQFDGMLHMVPPGQTAPFQAAIGTRQHFTYTTIANEIKRMPIKTNNPLLGIGIAASLPGTSMSAIVSKAEIDLDSAAVLLHRGNWYDHVRTQSEKIQKNDISYQALVTAAETLDTKINWIDDIQLKPLANNSVPSTSEFYHVPSFALAGGKITWGVGHKFLAAAHSGGAVTLDAMRANIPIDVKVTGYPDRYVYFPMGDRQTMQDLLDPKARADVEAVLTCGSTAGATASLILEELKAA